MKARWCGGQKQTQPGNWDFYLFLCFKHGTELTSSYVVVLYPMEWCYKAKACVCDVFVHFIPCWRPNILIFLTLLIIIFLSKFSINGTIMLLTNFANDLLSNGSSTHLCPGSWPSLTNNRDTWEMELSSRKSKCLLLRN